MSDLNPNPRCPLQPRALFLEAERRDLNNSILGFEQQIESLRGRIEAKEQDLKAVEQEIHKLLG